MRIQDKFVSPSVLSPSVDIAPVRKQFTLELFCAVRDSVKYVTAPTGKVKNANTRNSGRYAWNLANRQREAAREWIRAGEMSADSKGHGFGFLWESMVSLGTVHFPLDAFTSNMEKLWSKADQDPKVGARIIQLMKGMQDSGPGYGVVADACNEFSRMKESTC